MIPCNSKKVFIKPRKLDFDLSPQKKKSSSKQFEILEKFNNSLQTQLEKAKKTIEGMSFKSSKHCTFEDFRDSQFNSDKKNISNVCMLDQFKENINDNHQIKIQKNYSSKFNNLFFQKKNNVVIENKNRSNSSKKNNNSKGIIIENDFEDIIEGPNPQSPIPNPQSPIPTDIHYLN